jgi:ribonuclease-3
VLQALGPDHAREYEVEVRLDQLALARGTGRTKKEAEQAAARAALEAPEALQRALATPEAQPRPADPPVEAQRAAAAPAEAQRTPSDEEPST